MPGSTNLLRALRLIVSMWSDRAEWIDVSPKLDISFLPRRWHQHVVDPDEPDILNRRILEVAVFFELAEALQSGEIYVPGSVNYDSYTDRLYPISRGIDSWVGKFGVVQLNAEGKPIVPRPPANKPTDSAAHKLFNLTNTLIVGVLERFPCSVDKPKHEAN